MVTLFHSSGSFFTGSNGNEPRPARRESPRAESHRGSVNSPLNGLLWWCSECSCTARFVLRFLSRAGAMVSPCSSSKFLLSAQRSLLRCESRCCWGFLWPRSFAASQSVHSCFASWRRKLRLSRARCGKELFQFMELNGCVITYFLPPNPIFPVVDLISRQCPQMRMRQSPTRDAMNTCLSDVDQ